MTYQVFVYQPCFNFSLAFIKVINGPAKASARSNWRQKRRGSDARALSCLIYFFAPFPIDYIPHNYVIPQAMPHAIPQSFRLLPSPQWNIRRSPIPISICLFSIEKFPFNMVSAIIYHMTTKQLAKRMRCKHLWYKRQENLARNSCTTLAFDWTNYFSQKWTNIARHSAWK